MPFKAAIIMVSHQTAATQHIEHTPLSKITPN